MHAAQQLQRGIAQRRVLFSPVLGRRWKHYGAYLVTLERQVKGGELSRSETWLARVLLRGRGRLNGTMTTNGKPRLGGWTRIGIVLSVLWVLGVGVDEFLNMMRYSESHTMKYSDCVDAPTKELVAACNEMVPKDNKYAIKFSSVSGAIAAVVPTGLLPFFWLIAWSIRATYRWVRRGFYVPPSPQT